MLNNLVEVGKSATNAKLPGYFDPNHCCYEHRTDALKFLYRVKIYAKTAQNNKAKKCVSSSKNRKLNVLQKLILLWQWMDIVKNQ